MLRTSQIKKLLLRMIPKVITADQGLYIWLINRLVKPKEIILICFSADSKSRLVLQGKFSSSTEVKEIENLNPSKEFCTLFNSAVSKMASSSKFSDAVVINRNVERNPLTSNLLRYSHILNLCMKLNNFNANTVFVTDKKEIKKLIQKSLRNKHSPSWIPNLILTLRVVCSLPKFLFWYSINKFRCISLSVHQKPDILINTFVQNQAENNEFSDSYFPGVAEEISKHNLTVSYLISGYIWFPVELASIESNCIFPEFKHFKIKDFVKSLRTALRRTYAFKEAFSIEGFKLDHLWRFETRQHSTDLDLFHIGMRLSLFDRFSKVMPSVKAVVCEFEGMLIERAFAQSRNNSGYSFKVLSLQHNNYSSDLINIFPTDDDFSRNLLPNKIFFMGSKYLEDFRSKYPQFEDIGMVPAYRYRKTFENAMKVATDNWIGVVCGIRLVENLEIITWLKKHEKFSRVNFVFFIHPSMQPADRKILLEEMVGSSFSVSDTGFLQALNENSKFVVSSSSSGVIALFQNRQVLRIPTWKCADINPLEDFEDFYYHAENGDHVRKFLDLNSSLAGIPDTNFSPELIDSYFNYKINDLNLEISKISTKVTRRR